MDVDWRPLVDEDCKEGFTGDGGSGQGDMKRDAHAACLAEARAGK